MAAASPWVQSFSLQPAGVSMAAYAAWQATAMSYHCRPAPMLLQDEDKLVPVDSHKLFAISGEAGDRVNFSEYIIANVRRGSCRRSCMASRLPGSSI